MTSQYPMILSPHRAHLQIVDGRVMSDRKKVVIAAFASTADTTTLFAEDPTWEIWCLNNGYELPHYYDAEGRFRADRHFEMHPVNVQPANDLNWLHACPVPLYVLDLNDPVPGGYSPNAVQFPLAECERAFPMPSPYWASTFAYQITLAMLEGFTEIALLGMDFGTPREWLFERPNLLYWTGYAAGRGVRIIWPQASTLFQHGARYGYEYQPEVDWCQQGVDYLFNAWGYAERPEAHARRMRREQMIQEAIVR
jgi:hypothetical protein